MKAMIQTDGRGVCKSKEGANTGGNYIRQLSLEIVCSSVHDRPGISGISVNRVPNSMSSATTKREAARIVCLRVFARMSVLWEVTLLQLLKQELQNLQLSMVGLISALEPPKPCDIGTKKASLDDLHTSTVHGCVCGLDDWHAAGRGNRSVFD